MFCICLWNRSITSKRKQDHLLFVLHSHPSQCVLYILRVYRLLASSNTMKLSTQEQKKLAYHVQCTYNIVFAFIVLLTGLHAMCKKSE